MNTRVRDLGVGVALEAAVVGAAGTWVAGAMGPGNAAVVTVVEATGGCEREEDGDDEEEEGAEDEGE